MRNLVSDTEFPHEFSLCHASKKRKSQIFRGDAGDLGFLPLLQGKEDHAAGAAAGTVLLPFFNLPVNLGG